MEETNYTEILDGINDTSEAPIDRNVFYKCKKCGGIIPSIPKTSIGCHCGNIEIDKEMHRLWIGEYDKIVILKKVKS
jgi:hypothetical protein